MEYPHAMRIGFGKSNGPGIFATSHQVAINSKRSGLGGDPENFREPNSQLLLKLKAGIFPNYFDLGIKYKLNCSGTNTNT